MSFVTVALMYKCDDTDDASLGHPNRCLND